MLVAESTFAPLSVLQFEDGTEIRFFVSRYFYNNDLIYDEGIKLYNILKRKEKIEKIINNL